jgi:sorting nexin-9/18/33
VTGNFEDEFIAKRRAQLELWLNRMSMHPVIGQSEVFVHFLQCDDASNKWKMGKRKAEKDDYRGAQWFCTLTVPGVSIDTSTNIKERVEKFSKAAVSLDNSVKNVTSTLDKLSSLHSSAYKKELANFGKCLEQLGMSLNADPLDAPNNKQLSTAFLTVGNVYTEIGHVYGEQSKLDIGPLLDNLSLYRGIIQQMPDVVQFEKNAIQTYEEFQTKPEKLEGHKLMEVAPRLELINHVTFAEINLFNKEKVDDLNIYMRKFLQQQISFYSEITDRLKRALSSFEQIPTSSSSSPTYNNQSIRK